MGCFCSSIHGLPKTLQRFIVSESSGNHFLNGFLLILWVELGPDRFRNAPETGHIQRGAREVIESAAYPFFAVCQLHK
jgi:hypothetical protein